VASLSPTVANNSHALQEESSMPYRFEPGRIYRMPTHFGPAPGPRQIPAEANVDATRSPRKTLITSSFLTEAAALERHIPERFALVGDPVITVEFHYMTDIDWLAGRGYTMIHVWWPAVFKGQQDQIVGRFLAVMWENLADPIITGRAEIGQPKLYAEIPELQAVGGSYCCQASWMGFRFLDVRVTELPASTNESKPGPQMQGTLMLKYVPRTGAWGDTDICQVSFTPALTPDLTVESRKEAEGSVIFHRASWRDLPTMYHVVNALADLPVLSSCGGLIATTRGGKSNRDQRILT
jgi:acetoacetate decarboxylase